MVEMMMPQTMERIARAGGGLDIDCSHQTVMPDTMERIAMAAAASGVKPTIIFRNLKILLPDTAERIAAAGQGCVMFTIP